MGVVTIEVASVEQVKKRTAAAFRGEYQGEFISFLTEDLLCEILTSPRLALIRAMAGKGPMSLRAAARLVGKDVKTVHGDVHALLRNGILKKNSKGQIVFPYDAIHVDFTVPAAA
jgi:predicted transcriptional regulator